MQIFLYFCIRHLVILVKKLLADDIMGEVFQFGTGDTDALTNQLPTAVERPFFHFEQFAYLIVGHIYAEQANDEHI